MRRVKLGTALVLFLILPIPVMADEVYPMLSYNTFIQPGEEMTLMSRISASISRNYTVICRNNGTNVTLRLIYFNQSTVEQVHSFMVYNFTIFSFRFDVNTTSFDIMATNNGAVQIKIYIDLFPQAMENLQGDSLILFPINNPSVEYVIVTEYVPVLVIVERNVTVTVTATVVEYIERVDIEYTIAESTGILIAFGGFCVFVVYILATNRKKENKPIKKLSLDDMLEEFRKG